MNNHFKLQKSMDWVFKLINFKAKRKQGSLIKLLSNFWKILTKLKSLEGRNRKHRACLDDLRERNVPPGFSVIGLKQRGLINGTLRSDTVLRKTKGYRRVSTLMRLLPAFKDLGAKEGQ